MGKQVFEALVLHVYLKLKQQGIFLAKCSPCEISKSEDQISNF